MVHIERGVHGLAAQPSRRAVVAPTLLGTADAMRERECNGGVNPPAWRASDGRLWLATIGGVVAVDNAPRSTWRGQTSGADRSNSEPRLLSRAKAGEPGGNRTHNPQIKSLLLCQLSYRPAVCGGWHRQDRAKRPDTNRDISTSIALVQLASGHVVIGSCGLVGLAGSAAHARAVPE